MIRAALFDLDGTILDRPSSLRVYLYRQVRRLSNVLESIPFDKPDAEIFRRAVHNLEVSAEDTVMVGDHPEADIGGAKSFGMKAIWKRDDYWEVPKVVDGVIQELEELPEVISNLT